MGKIRPGRSPSPVRPARSKPERGEKNDVGAGPPADLKWFLNPPHDQEKKYGGGVPPPSSVRRGSCSGIRVLYRPGGPWRSGVASSLLTSSLWGSNPSALGADSSPLPLPIGMPVLRRLLEGPMATTLGWSSDAAGEGPNGTVIRPPAKRQLRGPLRRSLKVRWRHLGASHRGFSTWLACRAALPS
jgi:hypothetical protein